MNNSEITQSVYEELFHPVEHLILSRFLGVEPLVQTDEIDVETGAGADKDWISVEPDPWGDTGEHALDNAVARLALEAIQYRLPVWAMIAADGTLKQARDYTARGKRKISLIPRFLFGINWATSGPGYDWPETYYMTYIPGYHRYVVTGSMDSPDAHGYTDLALGHFDAQRRDLVEACGEVIREWWSFQLDGWNQQPWEGYESRRSSDRPAVSQPVAEDWAWQIWGVGPFKRASDGCGY